MRSWRQITGKDIIVGCGSCGLGDDLVSAANRWISCRWILAGWKMKKRLVVLGIVVAVVMLAAVYFLRGPGTVPAGQQPLTTLTSANAGAFESAFDADANLPRLVLVLSPT